MTTSSNTDIILEPSPPRLTIPQILLIIYSWFSFLVYVVLIYCILKERKRKTLFRSPFFTIVLWNSIADCLLFLHLEFGMRARKLRYFNFFGSSTPNWYASFTYALTMFLSYIVFFGFIPMAVNRFTAFKCPILHRTLWSTRFINLIYLVIWITSAIVTVIAFLLPKGELHFFLLPTGVLQLTGTLIFEYDNIVASVVTTTNVVICLILYSFSFLSLRTHAVFRFISYQKNTSFIEKRYLICGLCTTLPLLFECIRSVVQLYGHFTNNIDVFIRMTELWFFVLEIIVSIHCWTLLMVAPSVRRILLERFGTKNTYTASQTTYNTLALSIIADTNRL